MIIIVSKPTYILNCFITFTINRSNFKALGTGYLDLHASESRELTQNFPLA